ncbi:hypothetical protein ACHWQZ_G015983 [Mnemiopsis leidyi]
MSDVGIPLLVGAALIAFIVLVLCICANKNKRANAVVRYDPSREPTEGHSYGGYGGNEDALWDHSGPNNSTHILLEMRKRRLEAEMSHHNMAEEEETRGRQVSGHSGSSYRDNHLASIDEAREERV